MFRYITFQLNFESTLGIAVVHLDCSITYAHLHFSSLKMCIMLLHKVFQAWKKYQSWFLCSRKDFLFNSP